MAKIAENDYLSMHNRAGSSIEHGSSIDQGSAERKSQLSVNLSINKGFSFGRNIEDSPNNSPKRTIIINNQKHESFSIKKDKVVAPMFIRSSTIRK